MLGRPQIAIISFPGNNGDTENVRTFKRCGFDTFVFRWNDSLDKLANANGYFIGAGFTYEDRGRAGMVAGRDQLFEFLRAEAARGKVIVGTCNGAQVLIESGLIPHSQGLHMSLARNITQDDDGIIAPGFLNEWVYMKRSCARNRCALSGFDDELHIPIAHGEGRFTTKDRDVIKELKKNDQIVLSYCDEGGNVSPARDVTPNGSMFSIAGICNEAGNVVALMPHPERTVQGDPLFHSMYEWLQATTVNPDAVPPPSKAPRTAFVPQRQQSAALEIFIDTIIVNNEERTVEQTIRQQVPTLALAQYKYYALLESSPEVVLSNIAHFNPNKEVAYLRRDDQLFKWNPDSKQSEAIDYNPLQSDVVFVRRDEPDTVGDSLGKGIEFGVCYVCRNIDEEKLFTPRALEVFANPHASTLEQLTV